MPTYGYRCTACGHEFDIWQRMSDEPVAACPECGAAGRRLIFPAGIVFKGSGFYKTDSRSSTTGTASPSRPNGAAPKETAAETSKSTETAAPSSDAAAKGGSTTGTTATTTPSGGGGD